ncbi:signal peptidase I [Aurantiacibacter xanthus]|uniref:Signal peptidase I n=1 Tax=Aurantiacibacter xanthus TaxID=1784712 RepID=A0A3A1P9L2_9SPHN|nr:signal peptidase I [Aurantiacibacter xanthus]RIV90214.1 signal peptidase I [Aurantiacibacter xanthus]
MSDTDHIRELREPEPTGKAAKPEKKPEDARSFAWFLVKLVLIVLLFRTLVFTSFNIPSESMMPRLLVGDYLFAAKWPYGYSRYSLPFDLDVGDGRLFSTLPERGDVAIFKHPIDKSDYIKRVIGLPGDTIQMIDGVLQINGTAVPKEPVANFVLPTTAARGCGPGRARFTVRLDDGSFACSFPQFRETLPNGVSYNVLDLGTVEVDNTPPITVPEGHLLMMGDNRDNSQDSRKPAVANGWVGMVPVENLVGRASFMYFSTDGSAEWLKPWTWFTAARWSRIGKSI